MGSPRGILFIIISFIVLFTNTILFSQSLYTKGGKVTVLEIVQPVNGERDLAIKNIIQASAEISLREHNIEPTILTKELDSDVVTSLLKSSRENNQTTQANQETTKLLKMVKEDFVLLIIYKSLEKNRVELNLLWRSKSANAQLTRKRFEFPINFEFDKNVSRAVTKLIRDVSKETRKTQKIKKEKLLKQKGEEVSKDQESESNTQTISPKNSSSVVTKKNIPEKKTTNAQFKQQETKLNFLYTAMGFSPFIATGDASSYFNVAMNPSISMAYCISIPTGYIGIGTYIGLNYFFAMGFNAMAESYLSHVGLNILYISDGILNLPIGFFSYITGGPAVLSVNLNRNQFQSKIMGFLKGGIGINLIFNRKSGLIFQFGYTISLDQADIIMGFSPEILIYTGI